MESASRRGAAARTVGAVTTLRALAVLCLIAIAGCDSAGDASCSICATSFSDEQCHEIGTSQGCASGESVADTLCTEPTRGCQFHGCPFGTPIACVLPRRDAGPADAR